MRRIPKVVAALVALTVVLAVQAGTAGAAPVGVERVQALDQAILSRVNETRTQHGLRTLVLSRSLDVAATSHSRSMLENGFFAHESFDGTSFGSRIRSFYGPAGFASWSAGENLVYGTVRFDADSAVKAWLASPEHRRNMLDPTWREVGIASMHAASAGGTFGGESTWVVTMDFGARTGGRATNRPKPAPARTLATKPAH